MSPFNKELIPSESACSTCETSAIMYYEGVDDKIVHRSREFFGTEDGEAGVVFCSYLRRFIASPENLVNCPFYKQE